MNRALGAAVVLALVLPVGAGAQDGAGLDRRLNAAEGSRIAFHFEVDPEVTVCDDGFRRGERDGTWWGRRDGRDPDCPGGPLEVVVVRRGGPGLDLEFGPVGRAARDADLGAVEPDEAAAWLLSIHERGGDADAAGRAMAGAVVARDARPAPRLLALARDRSVDREIRRSALFWVSQVAARGIDASLAGIASDEAEDQEVRDAAVFALSQRPGEEAVPVLMEVARTAPHARTRRTALFWLSQSDDERVPAFFAELIRDGGG